MTIVLLRPNSRSHVANRISHRDSPLPHMANRRARTGARSLASPPALIAVSPYPRLCRYGKLGHGNESGHSTPCRVEALRGKRVEQVACGSRHTVVLSDDAEVYVWGDKENGVSGPARPLRLSRTPTVMNSDNFCVKNCEFIASVTNCFS